MPLNTWNIIKADPYLAQFSWFFDDFKKSCAALEQRLTQGRITLSEFATAHHYLGLRREGEQWVFREWAPSATSLCLIGEFSDWKEKPEYMCKKIHDGIWELFLPIDALQHGQLYRLSVKWNGGSGLRIPAYTNRAVQSPLTNEFDAQVWSPKSGAYQWRCSDFKRKRESPLIYEVHIGMAGEEEKINSYKEFTDNILPRIVKAGYNTIQIMGVQEHPYYGSFGYQVSNYFAPSSRFGTPEELKELIDVAHQNGITVLLDIVHSHSVKNEIEGLSCFDGTYYQYFHDRGNRKQHPVWDSRLFNYGKPWVLKFLLSNVRYWIEEFKFDGFRFDGVTSMLYHNHGIGTVFGSYEDYFSHNLDKEALVYLALANKLCHEYDNIITIAEDVSGLPGLAAHELDGGVGFDYRLALGIPDFLGNCIDKQRDEDWNVDSMYYELTNHRPEEKTISYVESHDQALVGDKTFIFRMIDADMYYQMQLSSSNLRVERGVALHKMLRLVTLTLASYGYLNFMGNEFGHPEWIDFPRPGNNNSYHYARRQWSLRDNENLYYSKLADFDNAMLQLFRTEHILDVAQAGKLYSHCDDQVLAVQRGEAIFIFNFSPTKSYSDYGIPVPETAYRLVLDSDAQIFGGQGRLMANQEYFSHVAGDSVNRIQVYLPTRTGIVLLPA
jgi:1,4-alpha-glucan branching enzyme